MVERRRHLAKAVTYRVLGTAGTAGAAYFASGDASLGLKVGLLDSLIKIGLYYLHERAWYRVRWGVRPDPDPAESVRPRAGEAVQAPPR
jgi:uncharacterized membrane protein